MPLPPPDVKRKPLHTRTIRVDSFAREDGQWDLEAELVDFKSYAFTLQNGVDTPAGQPFHHMRYRITIDDQFTITAALAHYDAAPYEKYCTAIAPDYQAMVGMNLLRNFRQAMKDRFSRTSGCTHLTELAQVLPTVAVQTMANQRKKEKEDGSPEKRPFQLEGCHALRLDGEVAKTFYPKWYVAPKA